MNIQRSPIRPSVELTQQLEEVDKAIGTIDRGTEAALRPPSFGQEHRAAIDSVVTGLASQLTKRIDTLHELLKQIEQQVLSSAERARASMDSHVATCVRVDDEIRAMQIVVDELAKDAGRVP
jgi:conjugal transfer/entry exclusion protein